MAKARLIERASGPWHSWFAWYPVYLGAGKWAWWRRVYRRWSSIHMRGSHGPMFESWYQYRECTGLIGTGFGDG